MVVGKTKLNQNATNTVKVEKMQKICTKTGTQYLTNSSAQWIYIL